MITKSRTLALGCCALLLASCGGGNSTSDDRARTITAPTTSAPTKIETKDKALTEAQLSAALITVKDLPTGYKIDPDPSDDDDDSKTTSDNPECLAKFEQLEDLNAESDAPEAEASFEGSAFGSVLSVELASLDSKDEVKERVDKLATVLTDCPSFTVTDEDGPATVKLGALSFPKLGDDTFALAGQIKTAEFTVVLNVVVIQVGRNVATLFDGGLSGNVEALERAARAQTTKLAEAAK